MHSPNIKIRFQFLVAQCNLVYYDQSNIITAVSRHILHQLRRFIQYATPAEQTVLIADT
jgi:hypothetical protein